MRHEEDPTSFSIEFEEILEDLKFIEKGKEPFFEALFVDKYPTWRKLRYLVFLHYLKKHLPQFRSLHAIDKKDPKVSYLHFLKELRSNLRSKNRENFEEAAFIFFTMYPLHVFTKKLVQLMQNANKEEAKDCSLLIRLKRTREQIVKAPRALKVPLMASITQFLKGQFNVGYDPTAQENTPYILFELEQKRKKTLFLRLGTQTHESHFSILSNYAQINIEFEAFIRHLHLHHKKHLYVNLQNRIPSWIGRNEAPKCQALEELSRHYPETLYFIGLAKNTAFYYQEGPHAPVDDAFTFKENFLFELNNPSGGYYFEGISELVTSDKPLLNLLNKTHEKYFHNKSTLTLKERLNFIELFYLEVEKYCIDLIDPDSVNISCKDGIDRAGGANALLYFDLFLKDKKLQESDIQDLEAILFAPAILVKKRAITQNRFDRFLGAIESLTTQGATP